MSIREPLPSELSNSAFTVGDAAGHIPSSRLRGRDLNREVYGTRIASPSLSFEQRCQLFQRRMPAAFISHVSAARLWKLPLPWQLENEQCVDISQRLPRRAPHANGIRGHALLTGPKDIRVLPSGVRVTSPARTWHDLASILAVDDLVAIADHIIHWRSPIGTRNSLQAALDASTTRRGSARLREALALVTDRSESPQESKLRVLLHYAGFPAPRVNHVVEDRFGEFVARTDLLFEQYDFVLEYMGDYHRTSKGQWRADMSRRSKLEAGGRGVMELNADDLLDPEELAQRIRTRIAIHVARS